MAARSCATASASVDPVCDNRGQRERTGGEAIVGNEACLSRTHSCTAQRELLCRREDIERALHPGKGVVGIALCRGERVLVDLLLR